MNTNKMIKLFVPALLLVSGSAMAGVVGSKHDITTTTFDNAANTTGQVCVYCHTPHQSITGNGPLWNHAASTVLTYTVYDSPTIDSTIGDPGGESKACLTCHDGTVAIDNISNSPGDQITSPWTPGSAMTGYALVGTVTSNDLDLGNDHPIGMLYDVALVSADGGLDTVANVTGTALELFAGKVECATCHDVHDDTNAAFLRVTDTDSQICTTCHLK